MADTSNLTQFLTDVANAIRSKTKGVDSIPAENFDTEIESIVSDRDWTDYDEYATALASTESILNGSTTYPISISYGNLFYGASSTIQQYFIPLILSLCTPADDFYERVFSGCSSLTELDLSSFDTSNATDMYGMFEGCQGLTSLDLSNFDTSNVTNMADMFANCSALISLDLSNFDTSNATKMQEMFNNCSGLTTLDLSSFDTSNVTDMGFMFFECRALTSLNISTWDTSNVTSMTYMFCYCSALTSLDLSSFTGTTNVTTRSVSGTINVNYMFCGCTALQTLDISGFDWRHTNKYCFTDCTALTTVYVKDEDSKTACDTALSNAGLSITSTIKEVSTDE